MEDINLEHYKPKQEILNLDDEVIELWYGKKALEDVLNCFKKTEIRYRIGLVPIIDYVIDGHYFVHYFIFSKNFYFSGVLNNSDSINRLVKDLFDYEIKEINGKVI